MTALADKFRIGGERAANSLANFDGKAQVGLTEGGARSDAQIERAQPPCGA